MSDFDAGRWMRDMALLRIGPDTEELSRHLNPGDCHHIGCLCPECSELRRAVGGGKRMDKHIAKTMEANERGRIAAEQEILAQARREAAARARVTRELAKYGAYPYRAAGEAAQDFLDGTVHNRGTGKLVRAWPEYLQRLEGPHGYKAQDTDPHSPCTCRDPKPGTSGIEDRPYAHDQACRRNYGQFSGTPGWRADHPAARKFSHEPGCGCGCEKPWKPVSERRAQPGRTGLAGEICVKDEFTRCGCRDCVKTARKAWEARQDKPALTPEQEIRAELTAFDNWMLHGPRYPGWMERDEAEPGRCRECRLGHADATGGLCLYCKLAQQVAREAPRNQELGNRKAAASAMLTVVMSALGCFLVSVAMFGYSAFLLPGLLLMAAGVARAWKR